MAQVGLPSSYVSDWLVVVNLGAGGARGRFWSFRPPAVADELRRLRGCAGVWGGRELNARGVRCTSFEMREVWIELSREQRDAGQNA